MLIAPAPISAETLVQAPAVRAVDARKVFGEGSPEVVALNSVSVDFERGQFTAVMGPSGSGKSTLLYGLSGLTRLDGGAAYLGDTDISTMSDKELAILRRTEMGFVFQSFHLVAALSARENITLPLDLAGVSVDEGFLFDLTRVLGIQDRLSSRPSELSGGQRQRVAVARALISRPQVVFADEPTGALDSQSAADLLGYMRGAVDDLGQTIVMVTHDPVAAAHTDRAVYLRDGAVWGSQTDPTVDDVLSVIRDRA